MALDKTRLRNKIYSVLRNCLKEDESPEKAFLNIATELSNAIDDYVRSADVVGVNSEVNATLDSSINLAVEAEVFPGMKIEGKALAAHGPLIVVGETSEKGKVLGSAKGNHINKLNGSCTQKGVGKLE